MTNLKQELATLRTQVYNGDLPPEKIAYAIHQLEEKFKAISIEANARIKDLDCWNDYEFIGNAPGHKVGNLRPMIKTKELLNKLL